MLPSKIRYWLFDTLSVQTMRYVSAVPTGKAEGLTKKVYDMIREDFFKNGSLTSRSKVPELMAAIWTVGRESMLVPDKVDRTTKDAISSVLSQINICPYCEDMLISLVHAGGKSNVANDIFAQNDFGASDTLLRRRLKWVKAIATPETDQIPDTPFSEEQLPEIFGTLMGMSDINRFSHVVMDDSPVPAPFGILSLKSLALKMFGSELKVTRQARLVPGQALDLLPPAELPSDMQWAKANPRVADAVSRYTQVVEHEGAKVISSIARKAIQESLYQWNGEKMPMDSIWIDREVEGLGGDDKVIARLAIVVAKAPYRVTEKIVYDALGEDRNEERFIRVLAWSSFTAARRFTQIVAQKVAAKNSSLSQAIAA
jgi:AhpD family alkylhydroperoxidase